MKNKEKEKACPMCHKKNVSALHIQAIADAGSCPDYPDFCWTCRKTCTHPIQIEAIAKTDKCLDCLERDTWQNESAETIAIDTSYFERWLSLQGRSDLR